MTASPPVRVQRVGWRQALPLTRDEVRRACLYAEAWVRQTTWKDAVDLMHALAWCVIEQLNRNVNIFLVGQHDIDDMPVVRLHVGEIVHHIAVRDTRMLANDTPEILFSNERIEAIVAARIEATRERAQAAAKLAAQAAKANAGVKVNAGVGPKGRR